MADSNIIKELTQALDTFSNSVEKDLEEVRKQKVAVQAMRDNVFNMVRGSYYLRDESSIILSAPKVIIGNVDANGNLIGNGNSEIILRGNSVSLEASGDTTVGGSITSRAASIRNIAVDPGMDGTENTVCTACSEIVNKAHGISLDSSTDEGCFVNYGGASSGITINSETGVSINATPSAARKSGDIEAQTKDLDAQITSLKTQATNQKAQIDSLIKELQDTMDSQFDYNDDDMSLSLGYNDIDDLSGAFAAQELVLAGAVKDYIATLSTLSGLNYRKKSLDAINSDLSSKKGSFATDPTGSSITMNSERFSITSIDGDANLRENKEAGLNIKVPHLSITANDYKGALIKDSTIDITTQDFTLSTVNPALDDKMEKGDIPAVGSVKVTSKDVLVQAIDNEKKSADETVEKALTAEGKITLRAETITASATDTEGKSTGKLSLNAKNINVASMDVDKDSRKDKEMAAGSQMVLLSEKMLMGATKTSKLIQVAAEKVGVIAKDTAEMQQDGKAVVTLSGGNMTAGGSAVELDGNTTISGNADIKGEAKAPKVTSDQVEVKSAFKSPNINDTMGAGVPGQAASPSAKMTEEEIKTES